MMRRSAVLMTCMALLLTTSATASAAVYSNDFSTNTDGWFDSGGTIDLSGAGTALVNGSVFTRWGGYSNVFQEYTTSIDVYLNLNSWDNGDSFDFSSAVSRTNGTHLRDFIFHVGFFENVSGDYFLVGASNNSNPPTYPNPSNPATINQSGWYTFEHHFYDNAGVLAVDMRVLDSFGNVLGEWTRSDPSDLIPSVVGGNRYGWFVFNEFEDLEIDNAELIALDVVPEPASLTIFGIGAAVMAFGAARSRRRSLQK
jgi:hypothetical protein